MEVKLLSNHNKKGKYYDDELSEGVSFFYFSACTCRKCLH